MTQQVPDPSMQSAEQSVPVNWPAALMLTLTPIAALILVPLYLWHYGGFSTAAWVSFFVLWAYSGLSITVGYHRLWAHRTYEANWFVRLFWLIGGTFAIQNDVFNWASGHRVHHRYVDDNDKDPYSAKRGFWFSHIGWMLYDYPSGRNDFSNIPDLTRDPMLRFQHRHYGWLILLTNFGIPALWGWLAGDIWGVLLLGGLVRLVWSHHMTFFINSLAHIWGTRPFTDTNTARNNPFLALLTWGEGYHNYHHFFQYDYRNGVKWWQYDPTKWIIYGLSKVGLTRNLRRVPDFQIYRAEMNMAFQRAQHKLETRCAQQVEASGLRERFAQEYAAFTAAMDEWMRLKEQAFQAGKVRLEERVSEAWQQADQQVRQQMQAIERQIAQQRQQLQQLMSHLTRLPAA